jgi:glyoxalase family protein
MITGLHHVTAVASDPRKNVEFYTKFLGLKLVKKTVNFDDPTTYHLYYGDAVGSPGTILTFFPWPHTFRGRRGAGQVVATAYYVPAGSLESWITRAHDLKIEVEDDAVRFGERYIAVTDPDGMRVELFEGGEPLRFHSVTLLESDGAPTGEMLGGLMGWRVVGKEGSRTRYASSASGVVDVEVVPGAKRGTFGAGIVHHVAFRTPDDESQVQWREAIEQAGHHVSPVMDRNYFHSIYYREPGGVLFEIATDPPGFAVDEPADQLGTSLKLPIWFEPRRAELEAVLPSLV